MGLTKRAKAAAEAGEEPRESKHIFGITAEQYKGIGRYLKPWGKPPTKFTFWCQIITTVVVIIISIGKALESLRDPTFLAFAIVGVLFGGLLFFGYVKAKRQQNRELAEEQALALREAEAEAAADAAAGRLGQTTKQGDEEEEDDDDEGEGDQARARAQAEAQARAQAMAQAQAQAQARAQAEAQARARQAQAQAQAQAQKAVREAEVSKQVEEVKKLLNKRVRIAGIQGRPELNGKHGMTTRFVPDKGRFAVTVEGLEGESVLLKPQNLTAVDEDGQDEVDTDEPPPLS